MADPRIEASVASSGAYGSARVIVTSYRLVGSTFAIWLYSRRNGDAVSGAIRRSYQNVTSSASTSLPSWCLTPSRSLNVHEVGLAAVHASARQGVTFRFSSNITRLW